MPKRAVVFVIARKDERVCVCVFQYKCPPRDKRCPYPGPESLTDKIGKFLRLQTPFLLRKHLEHVSPEERERKKEE
jgi:hypothetical protein